MASPDPLLCCSFINPGIHSWASRLCATYMMQSLLEYITNTKHQCQPAMEAYPLSPWEKRTPPQNAKRGWFCFPIPLLAWNCGNPGNYLNPKPLFLYLWYDNTGYECRSSVPYQQFQIPRNLSKQSHLLYVTHLISKPDLIWTWLAVKPSLNWEAIYSLHLIPLNENIHAFG